MGHPVLDSLPCDLKTAWRQFDKWRCSRSGRSRIPESLWSVATAAAKTHGLYRASKALRLDYFRLKQRVQAETPLERASAFMELDLSRSFPSTECTIEMQEQDGAKMTVHLKGTASVDLISLSGAFFGRSR